MRLQAGRMLRYDTPCRSMGPVDGEALVPRRAKACPSLPFCACKVSARTGRCRCKGRCRRPFDFCMSYCCGERGSGTNRFACVVPRRCFGRGGARSPLSWACQLLFVAWGQAAGLAGSVRGDGKGGAYGRDESGAIARRRARGGLPRKREGPPGGANRKLPAYRDAGGLGGHRSAVLGAALVRLDHVRRGV